MEIDMPHRLGPIGLAIISFAVTTLCLCIVARERPQVHHIAHDTTTSARLDGAIGR
jgi:hypothetical protein